MFIYLFIYLYTKCEVSNYVYKDTVSCAQSHLFMIFNLILILANRPNCANIPSLKCAHFIFWINPTGLSKFHNTSNHPPPATDLPTPLPPYLFPSFSPVLDRETGEGRSVPVPEIGVRYNSLLLMCTLNTLT